MTPRKYNNSPPARSGPKPLFPTQTPSTPAPVVLTPTDEVVILTAPRIPRHWLRVAFALTPGADAARAALSATWFATRVRAADKRLRLALDGNKSSATADELLLVFAPHRCGTLEIGWLEEVKPAVRELAAEFEGAELKSVEVVKEER